jgi:H+/Cl- antiporter ClcA
MEASQTRRISWWALLGATTTAIVSALMLSLVADHAYYEYYLFPRDEQPFYTYPEWRYTLFDLGALVCGTVGILAAVLVVRSAVRREPISRRARQLTISFVIILDILLAGAFFIGPWLRSLGWQ